MNQYKLTPKRKLTFHLLSFNTTVFYDLYELFAVGIYLAITMLLLLKITFLIMVMPLIKKHNLCIHSVCSLEEEREDGNGRKQI